jgi:sarcosine oxidase
MTERYDCIVLGLGGFGSAALYHAALRGLSVLGIEQFSVGHDRGSSHGETRIVRKAYFEHPDYVPLLLRAYALWRALEGTQQLSLMHLCGLLLAGPAEGEAIAGARLAARLHNIKLEDVAPADRETKFPGFRVPKNLEVVFEPEAGYLRVESCVRAHVDAALHLGASVAAEEGANEVKPVGHGWRVSTSKGSYESLALIVTSGPWAPGILPHLGLPALPLEVVRKPQFWFPVHGANLAEHQGAPCFYFEMPGRLFYGFPSHGGQTIKAAEHSGGQPVEHNDPMHLNRDVEPADWENLAHFLSECLPDVDPRPVRSSVCMYTLTPDRHFIVDRLPGHEHASFGAGFSGHGFKFTPVIGEILVDLAIDGRTKHPIEFLSPGRDAIAQATRKVSGKEKDG